MADTQKQLQLINCDDRVYSLKNVKINKDQGSIVSIEPEISELITVTDAKEEEFFFPPPSDEKITYTKRNSCCDDIAKDPACGIGSASLSADFSKLQIEVMAFHECGIKSIGGAIMTVTIVAPGLKKLEFFRVNGEHIVDGKTFECPSGDFLQLHTLEFPTNNLIGFRFAASIWITSCCDRQEEDDSVKSFCRLFSRTFFIT